MTEFYSHEKASLEDIWFRRYPNGLHIMETDRIANSVANHIINVIREVLLDKPYIVLLPSAGRTMQKTYEVLRNDFRAHVDWSRVICVQMDEYVGIGSVDSRSFASQLFRELVEPLGVGRFLHFYDKTGASLCSLKTYEQKIRDLGGIDLAIHGVGRNGHIAFNEPSRSTPLDTRIVRLAESTSVANGIPFHRGVTLGLGILGEAKESLAVLLGSEKCEAAKALLFDPAGPNNPASYLRSCNRVSVYLNHEAVPRVLK